MTRRVIRAVFLDVGGVLHLPDHDRVRAALASAGMEVDAGLLDRAHYAGVAALVDWPATERGIWTAYQEAYANAAGVPSGQLDTAVEALDGAFSTPGIWSRLAPGSLDGLRALAATGTPLAVVSNSDGTLEQRLGAEGICFVAGGPFGGAGARGVAMAAVVDSAVVGVAKPDPAIFDYALAATGVAPEEAIHVGDASGADVAGALAAGVGPVHLDPYGMCPDRSHPHVVDLAGVAALVTAGRL